MKDRLLTGTIGGGLLLLFVYIGGEAYRFLVALLVAFAYREMLRLKNVSLWSWHGISGLILLIWFFFPFDWHVLTPLTEADPPMLLFGFLGYLMLMTVLSKNRVSFDEAAFIIVSTLYLGFGFHYMLETRFLPENGMLWTFLIFTLTWATDTGAFFFGKRFGKHQLWPAISPNKTIEGSLGGLFFSILVSLLFVTGFSFLTYIEAVITAIFISVAAQFGDLIESAMKRHYQVKDTGTLLPGHGGVLDRFDSLIFVFPVLHLFQII